MTNSSLLNTSWFPHKTDQFIPKRTIMWANKKQILQRYSNPYRYHKGERTGIVGERENWLRIYHSGCIVSEHFVDPITPLGVSVYGPHYVCPDAGTTIQYSISGGVPLYNLQWHKSTDGINWTSSTNNIIGPTTIGDKLFVRLTVTDDANSSVHDICYIEAAYTWPGQQGTCALKKEVFSMQSNSTDIRLYPNPIGTSVNISNVSNGLYSLRIYNLNFKELKKIEFNIDDSTNEVKFDLSWLTSGIYILMINDIYYYKIVKV